MASNRNNRTGRTDNRRPSLDDEEAWFAARRFGIGSGRPIRWQGWALLAAYIAALLGISLPGEKPNGARIGLIFALTAVFLLIAARKTEGGWRGGKDDR
ncbi:hypothetical protein FJQ54_05045 [Sandaracinobacter neustonicus]|uniref:Uncharacterized protein n=1 Tax=Sandaracinobacter neustonicus TaxID=1715348 RepID=A0A501XQQ4_9SPHN|nr:hypothetical protein [Sandaracinobacter neustonicus]TPE62886.1 hypothetical protein FJQ54_05045 [Sandaracinobacter neustonicus]